jgi:ribosome-binding ATPase
MRLGIIGLPQSGKTTVFNALTRGNQPVTVSGGRFDVHTAVVDVPDQRVEILSSLFHPKKITYAKVTYADIAGLEGGTRKAGFPGQLLNQLSQMDGFIHVVRNFENARVPHPLGSIDPCRDMKALDDEFLLSDLISVERRLERLSDERKKGSSREKEILDREFALFSALHDALSAGTSLRDITLSVEENRLISGYGFLSRKAVLILFNLSEGQVPPEIDCPYASCSVVGLQGKLEMEIAQLPLEDASLFMVEYGIDELGLNRVISKSYELLGFQSFFTVGEDEVRAWSIRQGGTAYQAAGVIHTDLQKGFIRGEVTSYADLVLCGNLVEARSKGKLRLEGKEYIVKDGDIVHVRFNL